MKYRTLILSLGLFLSLGCGSKPDAPPVTPEQPTTKAAPTVPATLPVPPTKPAEPVELPIVKLKAEEFIEDLQENEDYPYEAYSGRTLELAGFVVKGKLEASGESHLIFRAFLHSSEILDLRLAQGMNPYPKVMPGQGVTLKTKVPTTNDGTPLIWEVVSVRGGGPSKYTVESFLAEYMKETDIDRYDEQHNGKYTIITGEIAVVEKSTDGKTISIILGKTEPRIFCTFPAGGPFDGSLKVGATVNVLGIWRTVSEIRLILEECALFETAK